MSLLRIASRPSRLAIKQAEMAAELLHDKGFSTEIVKTASAGDRDQKTALSSLGGTGIFVEEVNRKVLEGGAELAVHSAKDLPSKLPEELEILAVLPRENPSDVLISRYSLASLPRGAIIGTSSVRRMHELRMIRNDLKVENLRGNLDTRLKKLHEGQYDGIILARAGISRLNLSLEQHELNLDDFLPAPNQGIIAIVGRKDLSEKADVRTISHEQTYMEMSAERRLITALNLGCSLPAAILCRRDQSSYRIRCRFYSLHLREYKEFSRLFTSLDDMDDLADEIRLKVPAGYGYNFGGRVS